MTNGSPDLRIRVVGTHHILGLPEQGDMATRPLPANVERLWAKAPSRYDAYVFGDFRVCGWTSARPGEMEMVRLTGARNLVLSPDR